MGYCVYLLSPARCSGQRASYLLNPEATFDLARRLHTGGAGGDGGGVTLGEAFSFMSGLYFRGKLAYASHFAAPPPGWNGAMVITPDRGLVAADTIITAKDLRRMAAVPVDIAESRYRRPLARTVRDLAAVMGDENEVVLLGSIATGKYLDVLRCPLGERLRFPVDFVGRGDMSRGGLMLRCVRNAQRLTYVPIDSVPRHGKRPAKLERI